MYIFYDFETSSREVTGQILSYAFIVTDSQLTIIDILEGTIALNRTQCPDPYAILTNKLDVLELQSTGSPEYKAAEEIYLFLNNLIQQYKKLYLVGYNSNQFDLNFLRNLLIRYGFNPYFKGGLQNKDILHWVNFVAFKHLDHFPWVTQEKNNKTYYSFTLEDISQSCHILADAQTHNAVDDVKLTIQLVHQLQQQFGEYLHEFTPYFIPEFTDKTTVLKQKQRHFVSPPNKPEKFIYRYLIPLSLHPKIQLFFVIPDTDISLSSMSEKDKLGQLIYINPNKHFFHCEHCDAHEKGATQLTINDIEYDDFYSQIIRDPFSYFDFIKKERDIEFQIHELGFKRIDTLLDYKQRLLLNESDYLELLTSLLEKRVTKKDDYLIQLFNRVYLNCHSNPDPSLLRRYLLPRYINGTMTSDGCKGSTFNDNYSILESLLETDLQDEDEHVLIKLKTYYDSFKKTLFSA